MEGINFLTDPEPVIKTMLNHTGEVTLCIGLIVFISGLIVILIGVLLLYNFFDLGKVVCIVGILITIGGLATGSIGLTLQEEVFTGEYTQKVTIDDTVPLKEFLETYEIIDTEGDIYTIKW